MTKKNSKKKGFKCQMCGTYSGTLHKCLRCKKAICSLCFIKTGFCKDCFVVTKQDTVIKWYQDDKQKDLCV